MQADRLIDAGPDRVADLEVFTVEPAADALGLEVGVEAIGEIPVLGTVADEDAVELDRAHRADQGRQVRDPDIGETAPAKERLGDLLLRANERVRADVARPVMSDRFRPVSSSGTENWNSDPHAAKSSGSSGSRSGRSFPCRI